MAQPTGQNINAQPFVPGTAPAGAPPTVGAPPTAAAAATTTTARDTMFGSAQTQAFRGGRGGAAAGVPPPAFHHAHQLVHHHHHAQVQQQPVVVAAVAPHPGAAVHHVQAGAVVAAHPHHVVAVQAQHQVHHQHHQLHHHHHAAVHQHQHQHAHHAFRPQMQHHAAAAPTAGAGAGATPAGFGGMGQQRFGPGTGFNVNAEPYIRTDKPEEEIFKDHTAGIDFSKYESIEITVQPNDIPQAQSFADMQMHPLLLQNIARCSYVNPTPVQKTGIPVVIAGKDLMACAQTGSGKTAAYLLPAVNFVLMNAGRAVPDRCATPTALILAPTRELGVQIYDEGRKFTYTTGIRCVVVYGGAEPRHQIHELQRGCNLLVATPGRLNDMFKRGVVSYSRIKFLVLDEADRMLDMGFEPQIREIVEGAESDMPPSGTRQTLMYSATFPKEIQSLARSFLSPGFYFLQVGRVGSTTDNIQQSVIWVEDQEKHQRLVDILQQFPNQLVLVFVEKKRDCDYLERLLFGWGFPVCAIHGDRAQRDREMALNMFKTGARKILIATDVAARGLDIPAVSLVLQFDLPTNIDDYVHRIGRTGRAGNRGSAWAFFNEKNRNIGDELYELLAESKQEIPEFLPEPRRRGFHGGAHHRGGRGGVGGFRGGFGGRGGRGGGGHYDHTGGGMYGGGGVMAAAFHQPFHYPGQQHHHHQHGHHHHHGHAPHHGQQFHPGTAHNHSHHAHGGHHPHGHHHHSRGRGVFHAPGPQ